MAQNKRVSIQVKGEVYNRLICHGSFGDSLSDVINHVLDIAEGREKP